jgi:hypothetical protein
LDRCLHHPHRNNRLVLAARRRKKVNPHEHD